MDMVEMVLHSALQSFEKAGRFVERTDTIEVGDRAGAGSTLKTLTGGKLRTDRLVVVSASGPNGREVLIQPMSGGAVLPGELHLVLPGALRTAAEYGESGLLGNNWVVKDDKELRSWLRSEMFDANLLPNEMKQGLTKIELEWVVQLHPIAPDHSSLVIKLGGLVGLGTLTTALQVVDRLAPAVAQGTAPRAFAALHVPNYVEVANLALAGHLDQAMAGNGPTSKADDNPPLSPAERANAVRAALHPFVGKRVVVDDWSDSKKTSNITTKVAPETTAGEILGFIDTGLRASGKAGIAFTATTLFISEVGNKHALAWETIGSYRVETAEICINPLAGEEIKLRTGTETEAIAAGLRAAIGR